MLRTTLAVLLVASTSAYRLVDQLAQTGASNAAASQDDNPIPENMRDYYNTEEDKKCWRILEPLRMTSRMRQCVWCM